MPGSGTKTAMIRPMATVGERIRIVKGSYATMEAELLAEIELLVGEIPLYQQLAAEVLVATRGPGQAVLAAAIRTAMLMAVTKVVRHDLRSGCRAAGGRGAR